MILAATRAVMCAHVNNKLCPKDKGDGIVPCNFSNVKGPSVLIDGIKRVVTASLYSSLGNILNNDIFKYTGFITLAIGDISEGINIFISKFFNKFWQSI